MDEREPRPLRVPTAAVAFVLAGCFLLPFLSVEAAGRAASARGVELASGEARFSGSYRHDAFAGEVEEAVNVSEPPILVALITTLAGGVLALLPGRRTLWSAFAASLLALIGLLWFFQASSLPYSPPVSERRVGAWAALVLALGLVALLAWRLRRERDLGPEPPDLFARRR